MRPDCHVAGKPGLDLAACKRAGPHDHRSFWLGSRGGAQRVGEGRAHPRRTAGRWRELLRWIPRALTPWKPCLATGSLRASKRLKRRRWVPGVIALPHRAADRRFTWGNRLPTAGCVASPVCGPWA